jgi:hypothetical protein
LSQVVGKRTKKLAQRLMDNKDPEKSLVEAEDVLAMIIRLRGSDSEQAGVGRAEVAQRLESLSRFDEARLLREEILAADRRNLGDDHANTLSAEASLALNLVHAGLRPEAMPIFKHIRDVRLATLGPGDPETIWATSWIDGLTREFGSE